MRNKRSVIASIVLTLGAAGSVMAGSIAPMFASPATAVGVVASSSSSPDIMYGA